MKLAAQNRRSAFVLILLAVLLLFTVVGFAAGKSTTYYLKGEDGTEQSDVWIKLDGKGTYETSPTDGESFSGRYEQTGSDLVFYYETDGEEYPVMTGTLVNDKLTLQAGAGESEFYARSSSSSSAAADGVKTLRGYVKTGIEKLKSANYIGDACTSAFDGLESIRDYWWIIIGVFALIECFFGYRLFRIELAIVGFIGGFVGGLLLYPLLEELIPDMAKVPVIQTIIAAILGIAGLLLTQFFFKAAVVIGAGYAGYLFSGPYLDGYENELLYRILIGVGMAILAYLLLKVIIVLATGLFGGMLALSQLTCKIDAIQKPLLDDNDVVNQIFDVTSKLGLGINALTVALIIGAVIGLLGVIFQFANTVRKRA